MATMQGRTNNVETDAEEYVNSVMSSQPVSASLQTPRPSGRKRCLSASALETEIKKRKSGADNHENSRVLAKARRTIFVDQENSSTVNSDVSDAEHSEVGTSSPVSETSIKGKQASNGPCKDDYLQKRGGSDSLENDDIKSLLIKLSDDMMSMHSALNKKIDLIEARIDNSEKRITEKVTDKIIKVLDRRMNTETARMRKEIDEKIQDLRDDFNRDLNNINSRLDSERRENAADTDSDRQLRIVVRNLPESVNEDICEKVDALIQEGLKIRDANVEKAERLASRYDSKPGIVVAQFRSQDDKKRVMMAKKALRNSRQYGQVYINHDQSREERNMARNIRTLLNGVKRGHALQVKGSRIVTSENSSADRMRRQDGNGARGVSGNTPRDQGNGNEGHRGGRNVNANSREDRNTTRNVYHHSEQSRENGRPYESGRSSQRSRGSWTRASNGNQRWHRH